MKETVSIQARCTKYLYIGGNPVNGVDRSGNDFSIGELAVGLAVAMTMFTLSCTQAPQQKLVTVYRYAYERIEFGVHILLGAKTLMRSPHYPEYRWVQTVTTNAIRGRSRGFAQPDVPFVDPQPPDDNKPYFETDAELPEKQHQDVSTKESLIAFSLEKLRAKGKPSDDLRHWDVALRILRKIDANLVLAKLPLRDRVLANVRFSLAPSEMLDEWLDQRRPSRVEVTAGNAAPLTEAFGERRAFERQVRVLEFAIQLRKAVHLREVNLAEMPVDPQTEIERGREVVGSVTADPTIRDFMVRMQGSEIRSEASEDIIADYWNKLAFIAWEAAQIEKESGGDPDQWLARARKYIDIALQGRPNWTPGQLNLARIYDSENNPELALDTLDRVLGKKKEEQIIKSSPPTTIDNSDAIAALILKMAINGNPIAVASHIQRSYGPLSQEVVRKVTEALAGKLDSVLLDQILRNIPLAPPAAGTIGTV